MICVYAGLPADVVARVGGVANFFAVARWFDSNRAGREVDADKVVHKDDENHSQARNKTAALDTSCPKELSGLVLLIVRGWLVLRTGSAKHLPDQAAFQLLLDDSLTLADQDPGLSLQRVMTSASFLIVWRCRSEIEV